MVGGAVDVRVVDEATDASPSGIHQYKVLHTLGVGRHGEVKKAVHKISGCMVGLTHHTATPTTPHTSHATPLVLLPRLPLV